MDKARIDQALVFAGALNDCPNEWLLQEIAPHPDRLIAIGSVSPLHEDRPTITQLEDWIGSGDMAGLKFYVGYEHFFAGDEVMRPYLELLQRLQRPAIFHTGDLYDKVVGAKLKYAHPMTIDDAATDFPELKIIIAHMGWPYVREAAHVCSKNRNVYADVSGLVYGSFTHEDSVRFMRDLLQFMEIAPASKLIFGTDWPICNQESYVESVVQAAKHLGEPLFHQTAQYLFGLT
jgi:predicted TIM-barrel fold metal-dependent hydrolase